MRVVKGLVIVMAVLIFVGLGAVVWKITKLEDPVERRDVAKIAETLSLGLPAGCEIAGMEIDGRRLAVRTAGTSGAADCAQIFIIDLSSGELITTVAR